MRTNGHRPRVASCGRRWREVLVCLSVIGLPGLCLAQVAQSSVNWKPDYAFGDADGRENDYARVTLTAGTNAVRANDGVELTVRFQAKRQIMAVNPWCVPLLDKPFRVALFDADKNYLGDVGQGWGGSRRGERVTDVVCIPQNGIIETKFRVVPDASLFFVTRKKKAGRYYVQLIYDHDFSRSMRGYFYYPPYFSDDELYELITPNAKDTLRSNIVEIDVVD